MKKLLTLGLAVAFLFGCSGGDSDSEEGGSAKGTTFEITSSNAPLDTFEKKSAVAFKSGMNWNGKKYQPVLYLAVSNHDQIEFDKMWLNVKMPKKESDEILIVFQFGGKKFDHGAEPTKLEQGEYPVGGDSFNQDVQCSANMYHKRDAFNLMMQKSTTGKSFTGMATITKLTDDMVEGTIEMTGEDGTKINCEFSEKIAQDYWKSEFKDGKL
jgi:hypothetical protein